LGAQLGAEWNKKSQEALSTDLCGTEDKWYQPGRMFRRTPISDWAETLQACEGIIHFDAVLCRGPRHDAVNFIGMDPDAPQNHYNTYLPPTLATIALGQAGCAKCGSCPEGPAVFGQSPTHQLPLLSPPPLHSSSIRAAQYPHSKNGLMPKLFVRCAECLKHRWCERCNKWWDESCYKPGNTRTELQNTEWLQQWQMISAEGQMEQPKEDIKMGSKRDCFGCGQTCEPCKELYIRACTKCRNEYCVVDNDGSSATACDWCNYSGRRTRDPY